MNNNKIVKERVIFNNYEITPYYQNAMEMYLDMGYDREDVTEQMLYSAAYDDIAFQYEIEIAELSYFFENKELILFGSIGRWNGVYHGARLFDDFDKLLSYATTDCDYVKIYDENGHLYITCSHHDGTCHFEVKVLNDGASDYYDNWAYGNDNRQESEVYRQIIERKSKLPNYLHKQWGYKAREYEELTKEVATKKLQNVARSFYC